MELKKSSEARRKAGRPGSSSLLHLLTITSGGGGRLQLFILLRAPFRASAFSGKELRSPAAPQGGALL